MSRLKLRRVLWSICLIALLLPGSRTVADGQPILYRVLLTIGAHELITEVAVTPRQRFNGLSYRKILAENAAMLFVYSELQPLHFTMRDASIPLSIAFINEDFIINEIVDMRPLTEGPYSSSLPAKYALEVNQGWFESRGIKKGSQVSLSNLTDLQK